MVAITDLEYDVVEKILIGLDVKYLIRCKCVCKSLRSFIYSSRFIKAHIKYTNYNNYNRRIMIYQNCNLYIEFFFIMNYPQIVGSSNGLVCISPTNVELLVTNPYTREVKKLQAFPGTPKTIMSPRLLEYGWGFGYDSSINDYKVIVGFDDGKYKTCFYMLTLKTNIWKYIGDISYQVTIKRSGILYEGALYWFMKDQNNNETAIICFNLSKQEFTEIPQPDNFLFNYNDHRLGFFDECLCIYEILPMNKYDVPPPPPPRKKWLMKNYNGKQYWEVSTYNWDMMYGAECYLKGLNFFTHDNCYLCRQTRTIDYIAAPVYVKSLESPHIIHTETNHDKGYNQEGGIHKKNTRNVRCNHINCTSSEDSVKKIVGFCNPLKLSVATTSESSKEHEKSPVPIAGFCNLDHEERLKRRLSSFGFEETLVTHDESCLFRALAHQLENSEDEYINIKSQIEDQILYSNPSLYKNFVENMPYLNFSQNRSIKRGHRNQLLLQAAADSFWINISVLTSCKDVSFVEIVPQNGKTEKEVYLSCLCGWHMNPMHKSNKSRRKYN